MTSALDMASALNLSLCASKLSRLLHSYYAKLAFSLPPTSLTIWDHLIEDIKGAEEVGGSCTQEDALAFLSRFFSSAVVQSFAENLDVLAGSWLGLGYTLRHGKAHLACSIVDDIVEEHVASSDSMLHNFFGVCDGDISEVLQEKLTLIIDNYAQAARYTPGVKKKSGEGVQGDPNDGWQTPKKKGSKNRRTKGEGSAGGGARGGGDAAGGGGDRGGDGSGSRAPFKFLNDGVEVVEVLMSSFKTPEKDKKDRRRILRERSALFVKHVSAEQWLVYDPHVIASEQGDIILYHGTRTSSLESFRAYGIVPRLRSNEFSLETAFYATNSVRHAFKHPLHKHASKKLDPVSIITFKVSASILHGDVPPAPGEQPFDVMWFPKGDAEWELFCINNLKGLGMPHTADLVIGLICLPYPGNTGATSLKIDGVDITQVAFCSKRSREWLQRCAVKVFCEKREVSEKREEEP